MIDVERRGATAIVRMVHGKVNAMDVELLGALRACIAELEASDAGAVVVTGGDRAFSAGVDLRRVLDGGPAYVEALVPAIGTTFRAWFATPLPVVAAVNGHAIAGGCIFAATADRRLMTDGTGLIGASELSVGVALPGPAVEILRHVCGRDADEVVLTARLFAAGEAVRVGLVHEVVAADRLLDRAVEVAEGLAGAPRAAYAEAKRNLRRPALDRIAMDTSDAEVARLWSLDATVAGIRATLEGASKPRAT